MMTRLGSTMMGLPATTTMKDSRKLVLSFALTSRLLVLLGMVLSSALIPDLVDPGHDVLRFDLRLHDTTCFCLEGQACNQEPSKHKDLIPKECASNQDTFQNETFKTRTRLYNVLLTPFTRWDAARFLELAANPTSRQPAPIMGEIEGLCESDKEETCPNDPFAMSEQAHAFFPLFPTLIRQTATCLLRLVPHPMLPPSYEGVVVLGAVLLNFVSFVVAVLVLHDLTYRVTTRHDPGEDKQRCLQLSQVTAFLFCINPASVFFSTAYSESLFCLLTFLGYNLVSRDRMWAAALVWSIASFVRSNGTMASLWLLIWDVAKFVASIQRGSSLTRTVLRALYHLILCIVVVLPIFFHDWRGHAFHCSPDSPMQPKWCAEQAGNNPLSFSLYGYVQKKHWNVGFLNYYELKQIPNFLLAAPVLWLGSSAALSWIRRSWNSYGDERKEHTSKNKHHNGQMPSSFSWKDPAHTLKWTLYALRASVTPCAGSTEVDNGDLLLGPHVLAHFAVLAAFTLVGATIAHVQVSTRLIFSSCPALYWYMTNIFLHETKAKSILDSRQAVLYYCFGYIVVGVVMHVNWLPWT